MSHWISSLASFAVHVARVRECLKAVRTREEALDEMHRRREALLSKSISAEKKLKKMSIDNKNLRKQTDVLISLRDNTRDTETQIANEEASLEDWKRVQAKEWMGILFSGLFECGEQGTVVATFCRAIIGCMSTERTQPGLSRADYSGQPEVESLVVEAQRKLQNISSVGEVSDKVERPPSGHRPVGVPQRPPSYSSPLAQQTGIRPPQPFASHTIPNPPGNSPELDEFGRHNSHFRSQTFAPGQHLSPPEQIPPHSLPGSSLSLPPQGSPGFTPGHQIHLSQSSIVSGFDSMTNRTPPAPLLPLHDIPEIHPTPSGSRSGLD